MKRAVILVGAVLLSLILTGCAEKKEIKTFSAFMAVPGKVMPSDNRIMNKIAEKIGAKAEISWLEAQTPQERIQVMIESEESPDFIDGSDATGMLIEAEALIPLEHYLDDYPNLKAYLSEQEWNSLKKEDGHIYFIPQFSVINGTSMITNHSDEAFWIQKRVLKWAGYPKIKTLDEYFDLINAYLKENPESENGQRNLGFEILCDDWRYFCLENPPQFLAGYPNDGCAVVNPDTLEASVYDHLPEARKYYKRLCAEYEKGIIDPETFTMSYEEYLEKLASGCVLGMVDQGWQFRGAEDVLREQGMDDRTYVPLGLTISKEVEGAYQSKPALNTGNGVGISVSCEDVEGALQFLNDLLDPQIQLLRSWGEEGIDYQVGEDGVFYRTEEQRRKAGDAQWQLENRCSYSYFPHKEGMLQDGINAASPEQQPGEYAATLSETDREVLEAYGYEKWTDFLGEARENAPWFPLYSAIESWGEDTSYGQAKEAMDRVKKEWLPKIIMAGKKQFAQKWTQYQKAYRQEVDVEAYEQELTEEVRRRVTRSQKS